MRAGVFSLILALAAGLALLGWAEPVERRLVDAELRFLRAQAPGVVTNDVVIVGIDDESTQRLPEPLTLWHAHIGKFLEAMAQAGAAAVGLDVVLPDRSFEALVPGYDRALLAGILIARRTTPLVLALTVDPAGATRRIHPAFIVAAGPDATGYALLPVDDDGIVRSFDERLESGGNPVPTLAGQMARRLGKETIEGGLIDYAAGGAFRYIPLTDVLAWQAAGDIGKLEGAFGGRAVLLGGIFRFEDRLATPVALLDWDKETRNAPGVVVHAQVLRNLLNAGLIADAPAWLAPVLCLLAAMAWWIGGRLEFAAAMLLAGGVAIVAGATYLLARGTHLPQAPILLTLIAALVSRQLYEVALEIRERRRLRRAFGAYVSPRILQDILKSDPPPGLSGQRYALCVLFADIRGFTARSETVAPEATVRLLNRYFTEITESIHGAGGTLDKFIGDGVMAFFGAPQPIANPCVPAYAAARDMLARVVRLNGELSAQGQAPIAIGIGLHAGDAIVGNMGSAERYNYTAIGDAVNVAARLEDLTKEVGYPLVASATVVAALDDRAGFVKLGARAIKGHQPVEVYGWRPDGAAGTEAA
jgi:class 3 adenylate cyclase